MKVGVFGTLLVALSAFLRTEGEVTSTSLKTLTLFGMLVVIIGIIMHYVEVLRN
jgi:uncharacterized protein YjeT (DUF2065 family)